MSDPLFGIHAKALSLGRARMDTLAANIANAANTTNTATSITTSYNYTFKEFIVGEIVQIHHRIVPV